jgi:hypothetical protein
MANAEPQVRVIEIQCSNTKCKRWFRSPFKFGAKSTFDTATLIGNKAQCPTCGTMTSCNKENMRVRFEGDKGQEGFVGEDVTP